MSDKANIKQENHKQMNNLLLDVLHAWELKLMHNDCTAEEIRKLYDLVSDNLDVIGYNKRYCGHLQETITERQGNYLSEQTF